MRKLFILFAAVAFAFAFTAPATAEVNLSGYVAVNTYMQDDDNVAPALDDEDLLFGLDPCGRITFNFKEGPVSGLVEISSGVGLRHWWGTWNFGAGTLGVGHSWIPDFSCIGSSAYGCGAAAIFDPACTARAAQIQLAMGGLKIALVAPNAAVVLGTETDTSLPKLVASYNLNVAMVGLKFFGGYQSYDDVLVVGTTETTYGIDSYVVGLTASMGFGPLTVKGMVYTGENLNEYGALDNTKNYDVALNGTQVVDSEFMAFGIDLAYKVSDTLKVTAGYMTGESETDWDGAAKGEDPASTYHVNATFTLAKGVTITPEYAVTDYDEIKSGGVSTEQASNTYMGIQWKIAF